MWQCFLHSGRGLYLQQGARTNFFDFLCNCWSRHVLWKLLRVFGLFSLQETASQLYEYFRLESVPDMLMALLIVPFYTVHCFRDYSLFLTTHCWLLKKARDFAMTATMLNTCAITYDRYLAILRPLHGMDSR